MHQKQQEKQNEAQAGAITIKRMICNKDATLTVASTGEALVFHADRLDIEQNSNNETQNHNT